MPSSVLLCDTAAMHVLMEGNDGGEMEVTDLALALKADLQPWAVPTPHTMVFRVLGPAHIQDFLSIDPSCGSSRRAHLPHHRSFGSSH